MKAILDAKIESFRPFSPFVLAEAVKEWFEEDDAVPFMMQVFQIREEKRAQIPAVTHVDRPVVRRPSIATPVRVIIA